MTFNLLLFSVGVIGVSYSPELPSLKSVVFLLALTFSVLLCLRKRLPYFSSGLFFSVGVFYAIFSGIHLLAEQLPPDLVGQEIVVEGQVVDLPQEKERRQSFYFAVTQAYSAFDQNRHYKPFPKKIFLNSYGDLRVSTGEHWRFRVKLKRPRGFVNPGGFDYQVNLLRRGVGATGYLRETDNQRLEKAPEFSIDVLRYYLQQWLLASAQGEQKGILIALLVGDTSLVDKYQWSEMLNTGTNHLIAISGLHLGFFALVGFAFGSFLGRFIQLFWHRFPAFFWGHLCAFGFTLFYTLIAGSNIPTLRTLIMLATVQAAFFLGRYFSFWNSWVLALSAVLVYDPLAAYDIGFWLSFGAVAILMFCFGGRLSLSSSWLNQHVIYVWITEFIRSQWVMFIGLLIPLVLWVNTSSLLAPPANFIAIPVITFFVVPCLILAAICHFLWQGADLFFLYLAELGLSLVHSWLSYLLDLSAGKANPVVALNPFAIGLAGLSVVLLLLPKGLGKKAMGFAGLLVAFAVPLKSPPALQLVVLDVGQGTAVVVRTARHLLVYDTGPLYSENFDAGSGIIVPYLHNQGLRKIDRLVVSHHDLDHAGGLSGLIAAMRVDQLLLGEPDDYQPPVEAVKGVRQANGLPKTIGNCHQQQPWEWDGVKFEFLTWSIAENAKSNNHSCVLSLRYQDHQVLLTGDIEKDVEQSLLAGNSLEAVEVLLAPHHGSRSSSTAEFVAKTRPQYVIYSAGYRNQHGHPHAHVEARYRQFGATPFNTADHGAIEFGWNGTERWVRSYRRIQKRYWFE